MMDARLAFVVLLVVAGASSGAAHVTITMSIDSVSPAPGPCSCIGDVFGDDATPPIQV